MPFESPGDGYILMTDKFSEENEARCSRLEQENAELRQSVAALTADLEEQRRSKTLLLEGVRVGTWDWNIQTGETVFNDIWAEICGYTLEELAPTTIQTWKDLVHPEDLKLSEEQLQFAFSGDSKHYEVECRMRHKAGHWVWVLDRGIVVQRDENGEPLRMTGTHLEITERKNSEQQSVLLSNLLDSIPEIVFFKDQKGRYLGCNPPFCEFVGRSREDIIGYTDYDLFNADVGDFFREQDRLMMVQDESRNNDEWVDYPDGRHVLLDTLKAPLKNQNGQVIGLLGVSRDITSRRQVEDDLREAKRQYQYIFDNTRDVIYQIDLQGNYRFSNAAGAGITGYTDEELLAMNFRDLVAPEYHEELLQRLQDRLRGDREERMSCFELIRKDGNRVLIEQYTRPVFSDDGTLTGIQGVARDITDRRQAELELELRESYQSAIIGNLPGLVWLKDRECRILSVNKAFAASCNAERPEELCGKSDFDIFPRERAERYQHDDRKVMNEGVSAMFEEPIMDGGETRWFETFKTPVFNARGSVIGTVGYSQDITVRKVSERQIERLSNIQRELMRLATGFVNVPVSGQHDAINEALGVIGSLIGADRSYLFSYDWESETMTNTHEWCADGVSAEIDHRQAIPTNLVPEWIAMHRCGKVVHLPRVANLPSGGAMRRLLDPLGIQSLIMLPLMDQSVCLGFVGFDAVNSVQDWQEAELVLLRVMAEMFANFKIRQASEEMLSRYTERQADMIQQMKKMQKDLVRACEESKEAARAKSMFLANMSHEIRTPLNAILGYSQILQRGCKQSAGNPVCKKGLGVILDSGTHLLELINDVLLLSRNESQQIELIAEDFDIHAQFEEVRQMFDKHPDAENLSIELELAPSVPVCIRADGGKIRQVLTNLVGNAVKFTEAGFVRILVSAPPIHQASDDAAELSLMVVVADSGPGISSEEQESIFSVFEQAASTKTTGKGTGLGLAISRQYAQALGGDVWVESTPGEGSRFSFSFKAGICAQDQSEEGDGRRVVALADDEPIRRLLLVEDDTNSQEMLSLLLDSIGFKIEAAGNGEEALDILERDCGFDAVLLDKKMPVLNGVETLKRIRGNPEYNNLPILILTASAHAGDEQKLLAMGACGFLPKPLQEARVLQGIQQAIGVRYRYEDAVPQPAPVKLGIADYRKAVQELPGELVQAFARALHRGHVQGMRDVIERIAKEHSPLAEFMRKCTDSYDYPLLESLMKGKE